MEKLNEAIISILLLLEKKDGHSTSSHIIHIVKSARETHGREISSFLQTMPHPEEMFELCSLFPSGSHVPSRKMRKKEDRGRTLKRGGCKEERGTASLLILLKPVLNERVLDCLFIY
jgi:hypothetical protein